MFQFVVRKDLHLRWPRGETPTHYITMGLHEDLREATRLAVLEMIDFLVTEKHLTRDDAYMLTSSAADFCDHATGGRKQRRARHDREVHLPVRLPYGR